MFGLYLERATNYSLTVLKPKFGRDKLKKASRGQFPGRCFQPLEKETHQKYNTKISHSYFVPSSKALFVKAELCVPNTPVYSQMTVVSTVITLSRNR
jgi:hypothetical protein